MRFERPRYDLPELPDDITELDDVALMRSFGRTVAWIDFAATELAMAEVNERRVEAATKFLGYQGMAMNWNAADDKKVTIARAEMLSSEEYGQAQDMYFAAYAHRKVTEAMYENCERNAALFSRELTRRLGREPMERRNMRWNP